MCGIVGFLTTSSESAHSMVSTIEHMALAIRARGPDDAGAWADEGAGVVFGHRRLAVVDLTVEGHQPMVSACGRYVLTFNGEIYNFRDLREELERRGHQFRGMSDTEVILAAVVEWGAASAVERFNGMFAFGLWDRADRVLTLFRDRVGEKPLYYGWAGHHFLFASDLRAIEQHPSFTGDLNRSALALFLRYGNVPSPHCIYRGFHKLPPGSLLTVRHGDSATTCRPVQYWSASEVVLAGSRSPFRGTEAQAGDRLDELLRDSVALRMVADVPLGALLSGGVDSAAVVALMQAQSSRPVRTFTIGFREKEFDEASHARAVAQHLGTDHTELYLGANEAVDVIHRIPETYDEPFADASQIPTILLSGLVRRHVTVALSGDGGDELFGGYNRYAFGNAIWNRIAWIPRPMRQFAASLLRTPSSEQWESLSRRLSFLHRDYGVNGTPGDKFHKLADVLGMQDVDAFYERLVTSWTDPGTIMVGGWDGSDDQRPAPVGPGDVASRMMFRDLIGYLPDDILTKVDRASMSVSLEARVPMLDHRLIEFAWSLPLSMKISGGVSKRVLREVVYRYVPRDLIDRPKMGFGVPIGDWLRGPLREWAGDLLDDRSVRADGLLNPTVIRERWSEHLSGRRSWTGPLWTVLMLQAWRRSRTKVAEGL